MKYLLNGIVAVNLLMLLAGSVAAQEQLVPLPSNPILSAKKNLEGSSLRNTIALPFIDDFSYGGTIPDLSLWINHQAYVNTTFPLNPPSIGVVTLDGLNENGQPYDPFSYNYNSIGGADTLTSQSILLGGLTPADNVFLTFYFEAGGLGDKPNDSIFNAFNFQVNYGDSLILEFKDSTNTWRHIWGSDGLPGSGLSYQKFYQKVFQLTDPSFFFDDFQFRFRNIATRIGQFDCWNIDYVKLGSGRNPGDTVLSDVAIQYWPSSILRNYELMPWNQFQDYQSTEKASTIALTVKNNFNIGKNTSKEMTANETTTGTFIYDSGISSDNFDPDESKVLSFDAFDIPSFQGDSIVIATSFAIGATGGSGNTNNDSVTRYQIFSNEMAYDDGTAEAAYELLGSPASLALEYHLNTPDTLRAVKILFAHTDVNISSNLFNLLVWSRVTKGTNIADTLLRDEFLLPEYTDQQNGFAFYRLSRPVAVSDTFYIGWLQVSLQTDLKLEIGFDKNDTSNQHLLFNVDGLREPSGLQGALMMRPVLSPDAIPFQVGIPEVNHEDDFTIFPNPATDEIHVGGGSDNLKLEVMDYSGRILAVENRQTSISVRQLPGGFYFLRITDLQNGKTSIHKFVKAS